MCQQLTLHSSKIKHSRINIVDIFAFRDAPDGVYNILENGKISATKTYCQMTSLPGCVGGGWTLVMKIDGNKVRSLYPHSVNQEE